MGVDVGGTFTKGVVVDDAGRLVAKEVTSTTHHAPEGVVEGILTVLSRLVRRMPPGQEVEFVGFSTTQPVNALLEGDVAPVGILTVAPRTSRAVRRSTRLGSIELEGGKELPCPYETVPQHRLDAAAVAAASERLRERGAASVAVTAPFGIEETALEDRVCRWVREQGLPAVAGHEMSMVYGLEIRTQTAALNAALVPKMAQVADLIESTTRKEGLWAPVMAMRGDGGVMRLPEFREKPLQAVYSGPGASLAGALAAKDLSDGVFIEVGGTSTNVGVIKDGRPLVDYVRVGKHPTCLRSLFITVLPVAGGSMLRTRRGRLDGVGPRSAHVAGLPYASFAPALAENAEVERIAPRVGDPEEYLRATDGRRRVALTLTCAANLLGYTSPGDYAHGDPEAARRAFDAAGELVGTDGEELALQVLQEAAERTGAVVREMARQAGLRDLTLVGGGGGAAALLPPLAEYLEVPCRVVEHPDVISSIGITQALIRSEMEYSLRDADNLPEVLARARERMATVAPSDAVALEGSFVPEKQSLRVVIEGSTLGTETQISEDDAQELAGQALGVPARALAFRYADDFHRVFQAEPRSRVRRRSAFAVVDAFGAIPVVTGDGRLVAEPSASLRYPSACVLAGRHRLLLPARMVREDTAASLSQVLGREAMAYLFYHGR